MTENYLAGHSIFGQAAAPETAAALGDLAAPASASKPRLGAGDLAPVLYEETDKHGLGQSGEEVSEEARWVIEYALGKVGIENAGELRQWLSAVLGAAASGRPLRGMGQVVNYIQRSARAVDSRGF